MCYLQLDGDLRRYILIRIMPYPRLYPAGRSEHNRFRSNNHICGFGFRHRGPLLGHTMRNRNSQSAHLLNFYLDLKLRLHKAQILM